MDFLTPEAGQKRRNWLEAKLGGMWEYVPPELRPFVALGNELNPVTSMERAGTAAQKVVAPNVSGWDRMAAAGDMASNMAGVVAPMIAASKGAVPAVQAAEDALMGWSTAAGVPEFMADEFGGVGFRAFHGSPHDFDRFDLSKIGTGEGAQAYGHGLYFADSEDVARAYREGLSGVEPKGVDFSAYGIPEAKAKRLALNWMDYQRNNPDELAAFADDSASGRIVRDILDGKITEGVGGRMYEVQINADPNDFLDWDKPLSEQPAAVREAFAGMGRDYEALGDTRFIGVNPDRIQYDAGSYPSGLIKNAGDRGQVEAELRARGIPGIRYLDAGSRGAGDGSRNYVVFDDKLIEILRKYGLVPGMIGAGAYGTQPTEAQAGQ